jgi:hypothetical protein
LCALAGQSKAFAVIAQKLNRYTSLPPPLSTVNDTEIAHFSRLSALWWDERGEFALLHKNEPAPHAVHPRNRYLRCSSTTDGLTLALALLVLRHRSSESSRVLEGNGRPGRWMWWGGILSEVCLFLARFPVPNNDPNKSLFPLPVRCGVRAIFGFVIDRLT